VVVPGQRRRAFSPRYRHGSPCSPAIVSSCLPSRAHPDARMPGRMPHPGRPGKTSQSQAALLPGRCLGPEQRWPLNSRAIFPTRCGWSTCVRGCRGSEVLLRTPSSHVFGCRAETRRCRPARLRRGSFGDCPLGCGLGHSYPLETLEHEVIELPSGAFSVVSRVKVTRTVSSRWVVVQVKPECRNTSIMS
jgi:hypothetical protein